MGNVLRPIIFIGLILFCIAALIEGISTEVDKQTKSNNASARATAIAPYTHSVSEAQQTGAVIMTTAQDPYNGYTETPTVALTNGGSLLFNVKAEKTDYALTIQMIKSSGSWNVTLDLSVNNAPEMTIEAGNTTTIQLSEGLNTIQLSNESAPPPPEGSDTQTTMMTYCNIGNFLGCDLIKSILVMPSDEYQNLP